MATFFSDFSNDNLNTIPSGFVSRWKDSGITDLVRESASFLDATTAAAMGVKLFRVPSFGISGDYPEIAFEVTSISAHENQKLYATLSGLGADGASVDHTYASLVLRGAGAADTETGYELLVRRGAGNYRLRKIVDGAISDLTTATLPSEIQEGACEALFKCRPDGVGGVILEGWVWDFGTPQPTSPTITHTDLSPLPVGWASVGTTGRDSTRVNYGAVGVGTGEDEAPRTAGDEIVDPPAFIPVIDDLVPSHDNVIFAYSYGGEDATGFQYRLNGGAEATLGVSPATISGLSASTPQTLEVRASNSAGFGEWSPVYDFTTRDIPDYLNEYLTFADSAISGPPNVAIYRQGVFIISTVNGANGDTVVSRLEGSVWTHTTIQNYGNNDIHNLATVTIDDDGYVYAACVPHGSGEDITFVKSQTPFEIDFGTPQLIPVSSQTYYPSLVAFSGNLILFVNDSLDRNIRFKTSSDSGATWSGWSTLFLSDGGDRPYYNTSIVDGEVVIAFNRTNPKDDPAGYSHAYFARFDGVNWKRGDGSHYPALPLYRADMETFYDAASAGKNAGYRPVCAKDGSGRFVVYMYATDQNEENGKLFMCRHDGTAWQQSEIAVLGVEPSWMPSPFDSQPYRFWAPAIYDGVAQIAEYHSLDEGLSWVVEQKTTGTLARGRGSNKHIDGLDGFVYCDISRSSSTNWSSDVYLTFDEVTAGLPPQGNVTIDSIEVDGSSAVVNYSYSAADQTGFQYQLNDGSWVLVTSPFTLNDLPDGSNSLAIRALNSDGFSASATGTIVVDTTANTSPQLSVMPPLRAGEMFAFSGSNYSAQPTGPMTFTQGTRTISRAVTISNWNAEDGSFTGVTDTALPGVPAAGASDTPALLYGEPVTISLPDSGA